MSVQHSLYKGEKFLKENAADLSGIKFLRDCVIMDFVYGKHQSGKQMPPYPNNSVLFQLLLSIIRCIFTLLGF